MWGDALLSLLFTALGAGMFFEAQSLPEGLFGTLGPGYFPRIILGCLVLASGSLTVRLLFRAVRSGPGMAAEKQDGPSWYKKYRFVGLTFTAFFLYLLAMRWFGFLPSTLVFMLGTMWMLAPAEKNWRMVRIITLTSLLLTGGLYGLFTYGFTVMLPSGSLF